jgi:trehalose-phosphatase
MLPKTQNVLKRLSENDKIFMAIISGRAVEDVRQRVGINGIIYAGNHGLEISYPNGTNHDYHIPNEVADNYVNLLTDLEDMVRHFSVC